jgi:hypothetical protein
MNRKQFLAISAVAVAAAMAASTGVWLGSKASHTSGLHTVAAVKLSVKSSSPHKQWFVSTKTFRQAGYAKHQTGPGSNALRQKNGPRSVKLERALSPMVAGHAKQGSQSTTDIGSGTYAVGQVTWQSRNGGVINITIQKLATPLPLEVVAGDTQPAVMTNGTEYVTVDHSPYFRQVIMIKPDGTCIQITSAGLILRNIMPEISMAELVRIANVISGKADL